MIPVQGYSSTKSSLYFSIAAPTELNMLPLEIRTFPSLEIFTNELKTVYSAYSIPTLYASLLVDVCYVSVIITEV